MLGILGHSSASLVHMLLYLVPLHGGYFIGYLYYPFTPGSAGWVTTSLVNTNVVLGCRSMSDSPTSAAHWHAISTEQETLHVSFLGVRHRHSF